MKIEVLRYADNGNATLGLLLVDGVFNCFTVEDEERAEKIKGETRIPNGTYTVSLRANGGFHSKYSEKYGDMHRGMLCIHNADDWKIIKDGMEFQFILIHTGNTEKHTMGCLLVNDAVSSNTFTGSSSVDAYKELYPLVATAIECGEEVKIEYKDIEWGK